MLKDWIKKNLKNIIVISFIIPILLVAFVSISHVTIFYEISNPLTWAIYLSIAVEIAALSALAGLSVKIGKFIYVPFIIVTIIQFVGNLFFSFNYIDETSKFFQDWVLMVSPIFENLGVEAGDLPTHKTILAFFSGGLLPFISLTFAHMLVVYTDKLNLENPEPKQIKESEIDIDELSKVAGKMEAELDSTKINPTEEELEKIESVLTEIQNKKFESENIEPDDSLINTNNQEKKRLSYLKRDYGTN